MKTLAFRLHPGDLLKEEVESRIIKNDVKAGCILSMVGALKNANLRMAGAVPEKEVVRNFNGPIEIVSATGTVSAEGCHIHISISDTEGTVFGGHLKDQCEVDVTVEVVIGIIEGTVFNRMMDQETGYKELEIQDR